MHANPKTHAHLNFPWHPSRTRRLVLWDLGLGLAIVLWFAFLVTRVDAAVLTGLSNTLHEQPAANSDEPILRSTDLATVDDLVAQLRNPISSVRVNAAQALAS